MLATSLDSIEVDKSGFKLRVHDVASASNICQARRIVGCRDILETRRFKARVVGVAGSAISCARPYHQISRMYLSISTQAM
jgi:hypothetical protein